jgi:hypothetical protein
MAPQRWGQRSTRKRAQLTLRQVIATDAVRRYRQAGFTLVYQDILIGHDLVVAMERFGDLDPRVVVLAPSVGVLAQRDRDRPKTGYSATFPAAVLADALARETPRIGQRIDSSAMDVDGGRHTQRMTLQSMSSAVLPLFVGVPLLRAASGLLPLRDPRGSRTPRPARLSATASGQSRFRSQHRRPSSGGQEVDAGAGTIPPVEPAPERLKRWAAFEQSE